MNEPKVSIIILNWNGLKDTLECLRSLKKINYLNYEIIVVDNGSSNNEKDIIEKYYPEIRIIRNSTNQGFSRGNNIGAKLALENKPDYLLFLNNDTIVTPDFLKELVNFCQNNQDVGCAGPLILDYYQKEKVDSCGGNLNKILFSLKPYKFISKEPIKNLNFVSGCAFFIRSSIIERVGLWDEDFFSYWEDVDFCLRIKKANLQIASVPSSVIYHKANLLKRYFSKQYIYYMTRNNLLIIKKHASFYEWPTALINFVIRKCLGYFFILILIKNYQAIPAIFWAVYDFVFKKYGKGRY
jgi:GT2 family glycosyltransferase